MSYVPNADDATQPTTDKFVISAAEEFRKIKAKLNAMPAAGGGPVSAALGGTVITNFSMTDLTVGAGATRTTFADTIPAGWNLVKSSCYLQFEFVSTAFFQLNPNAHFAVVTRCDTAVIATAVRGMGAVFGDVTGAQEGVQLEPAAQIETWANGLMPATNRFLMPFGHSPTSKPLLDGIRYRVQLESINSDSGTRFIRLCVQRENAARAAWDVEFDTGYVPDDNVYSDVTKSGLVFGIVGNFYGGGAYSLAFSNIKIVWGPPPMHMASNIDRLSRYGDFIEGNMEFRGVARKVKLMTAGSYTDWTAFQAAAVNANSTVMTVPNGTSVNANFLATNASNLVGAFGYVALGMEGANAVLSTLGISGHAQPPILVKVNGGTAMTFKQGESWLPFATFALNRASTAMIGPFNVGGVQAGIMAANVLDYESLSTSGVIRTYMSVTPTNEQVEVVVRPLFGLMSQLISELRAKKVI